MPDDKIVNLNRARRATVTHEVPSENPDRDKADPLLPKPGTPLVEALSNLRPASISADLAPTELFEAARKDRQWRDALEELERATARLQTATKVVEDLLEKE